MSFNFLLFFSLFARLSALFLLSPLFSSKTLPAALKLGFTLITAILLYFPYVSSLPQQSVTWPLFVLHLIKEGCIGYLLGFFFALLIESARLGAQMIATLSGFSATELVNPNVSFPSPVLGRFFVIAVLGLFVVGDFHHLLLYLLKDTFVLAPISFYPFNPLTLHSVIEGTTLLFQHALDYAFIPFVALTLVLIGFALFTKLFPHVPVFFIAPPLQILIALLVLSIALCSFEAVFNKSFLQIKELSMELLHCCKP